jgi:hypothetical protein
MESFRAQESGAAQLAEVDSDLYNSTGDGYLQFDYAGARSLDAP